ncbi:MAG: helix-turn-helix domain-containing protein [Bacteroidota bacterium]
MPRKYIDNPNSCTLVHTMNCIGNKWKPIILYLLSNGPLRFGMLNTLVPTISKKVLVSQLKELEHDGLIERQSFPEIPPRVEYSLTHTGTDLLPALKLLSEWAKKNYPKIVFEKCRIQEVDSESYRSGHRISSD